MADADFMGAAAVARTIALTDYAFGGDPAQTDLNEAAKTDLWSAIRDLFYQNPPSALNEAQRTALRTLIAAAMVAVNSPDVITGAATTLTVNGTTYSLADDVEDVTDTGLPTLTGANYRRVFIDHDTPRVWVGHREVIAGTAAQGDFTNYAAANYRGALLLNGFSPPNTNPGQFWYDTGLHTWRQARLPDAYAITVAYATLFPDSDWLGEQPDDATAATLVDNFDTARAYRYYNSATNRVRVLTNSTYVAAVAREEHYTAEPISSPNVVGTVTGITAGAGLTGGGMSGVIGLDIDPSEADFPTIPVNRGGTGATTAEAARAALGLARSYFAVSDSGVGGTGDAITLTTGASLTALAHGMQFFFDSEAANTGAVTIDVDGIGPVNLRVAEQRANGDIGSQALSGGEISNNDPLIVVYSARFNEFYLLPARAGTAAFYNVGDDERDVPILGAGGVLDAARIPAEVARLASPALTGTPTVPTAPTGTSTTQAASTAFVAAAIAAALLGGGSDGVLSTATFDDATDELVLTLSTGTVLRVPFMDLIAGLVTTSTLNARVTEFFIPPSGVGGTGGAVTLTTGLSLPQLRVGDRFHFIAEGSSPNTGVTIAVDGGTPAALRKHGGNGGQSTALLESNDIRSGFPVVATWNGSFFDFGLGRQGDAVLYNVGSTSGRLAALGTGGRFADARIPESVARLAGAIFTGAAGGIDPTDPAHFVTLRYFNANSGGGVATMHDLLAGWSADAAVDGAEAQTGASSDSNTLTLPTDSGSQYLWIWRADADGGDPSEVHIAGGGNIRNTFGAAAALTVDGTDGQLIVSAVPLNAALLGGETLRVV